MAHWARGDSDRALTDLLIDSVVDYAMFVLDVHGGIRSWNPGAERLKGYTADEIIGQNFSLFYTDADRADGLPSRLLATAAAQGRVRHTGWRVRKDGTPFYGDVTITALRGDDGELLGFAKVTRDLTERHEADIALGRALEREREAAHELARLDETRTKFMAALSHDLRTPLGALQGSIDLLRTGGPQVDQGQVLDLMERNVARLLAMTTQLSEISRLQRGQLTLEREAIDLRAAVDECLHEIGPVITDVEVEVSVHGMLHVDPLALQRVLANLLTNAVRHSPSGATVTVRSRTDTSSVVLMVEDRGPGVAAAEREVIFEEFRQGRDRRAGSGLGLGLTIVRQYARAHGGDAWVEDAEDGGARFCVALPPAGPATSDADEGAHAAS